MTKYTFMKEDKESGSEIHISTRAVSLSDLLEDFADFLRACGFGIDGYLDIVNDDWCTETLELPAKEDLTEEEKRDYNSFLDSLVIKKGDLP